MHVMSKQCDNAALTERGRRFPQSVGKVRPLIIKFTVTVHWHTTIKGNLDYDIRGHPVTLMP
jgi:hypothetical protein